MSEIEPQKTIAQLNDEFRKTAEVVEDGILRPGIFPTVGVQLLPDKDDIVQAVRDFDDFSEDNDPYKEHDYGSFDWRDERVLWKFDYYDRSFQYWEDPQSSDCQRVLTIMLAGEY